MKAKFRLTEDIYLDYEYCRMDYIFCNLDVWSFKGLELDKRSIKYLKDKLKWKRQYEKCNPKQIICLYTFKDLEIKKEE